MPSKMLGCNGRLASNSKSFPESAAGKGLEPEEVAWILQVYVCVYIYIYACILFAYMLYNEA